MRSGLAAVAVLAALAGPAAADIPHPPQGPKLFGRDKTPTGAVRVRLGPGVGGYVFVSGQVTRLPGQKGPPLAVYHPVELSTDTPADLTSSTLHAIPEAEAKRYPTVDELIAALRAGKLAGVQRRHFPPPESGDERHVVTGIDDAGIRTSLLVPPVVESARTPRLSLPGLWCGGLSLALGVTVGGLWLVRRGRKGV